MDNERANSKDDFIRLLCDLGISNQDEEIFAFLG